MICSRTASEALSSSALLKFFADFFLQGVEGLELAGAEGLGKLVIEFRDFLFLELLYGQSKWTLLPAISGVGSVFRIVQFKRYTLCLAGAPSGVCRNRDGDSPCRSRP